MIFVFVVLEKNIKNVVVIKNEIVLDFYKKINYI
jgi:hypothetical protein